jgi:hypothetical protein
MGTRPVFENEANGRCELELSGYRHQCRLDRFSASGAELNCLGFLHETLKGDKALLHLDSEPESIACRVRQIAGGKIRLQFGAR